jgi:hypothetical protein
MNGPFKMKPGRGSMPKTGRGIPTQMKSPSYITGDPTKEKVTEIVDRPTSTVEKSGDVFKGTTTKITTKTPRRVITTQDAKFKELENVKTTEIKTTGLTKPKTTGPKAKINVGRLKEKVDPIERVEVIQQTGGPQGYMGYGRQTIRRVDGGGLDVAAQAIRQAPRKETTVVRGIRKSGETKDIFSKGLDKSKYGLSGKFIYGEKTGAEKILERRAKLAEQKKQRLAKK